MDFLHTLVLVLDSTIRLSVPLLLACLAGLYSERAGVFDIGLEGKMLAGAFAGAAAASVFGSAWAGLQSLVLDVKVGSGAFMEKSRDAVVLASSLVEVANGAGLKTSALITDMNEPLASAAGNAVEVQNAVDFLTGRRRDPRLEQVTLALAADMLHAAGLADSNRHGLQRAKDALETGRAAEGFGRMVAVLGGPTNFVERATIYLPQASIRREIRAQRSGFVSAIATREIGLAVVALGGGRTRPQDTVDHAVGLTELLPVGASVEKGEPLAVVLARDDAQADRAENDVLAAYSIAAKRLPTPKTVLRRVLAN